MNRGLRSRRSEAEDREREAARAIYGVLPLHISSDLGELGYGGGMEV